MTAVTRLPDLHTARGRTTARLQDSGRLLLLDVGGVLLGDVIEGLFDDLAGRGPRTRAEIGAFYGVELRHDLWSGRLPEREFWDRLLRFTGQDLDPAPWRADLVARLVPLPALERLGAFAQVVPIWLLSNHRAEWLRPVLAAQPAFRWVTRVEISSETGQVKPEPRAFQRIIGAAPGAPSSILFIDDHPQNIATARSLGLRGLIADPAQDWLASLEAWVNDEPLPNAA